MPPVVPQKVSSITHSLHAESKEQGGANEEWAGSVQYVDVMARSPCVWFRFWVRGSGFPGPPVVVLLFRFWVWVGGAGFEWSLG